LLNKYRPIISKAVPTIDLPDDELAAVTAAIRRAIEDDRFPHAPPWTRFARRWRGSTRRRRIQTRTRRPRRQPKATTGRGDNDAHLRAGVT
jgi:hypothetical protein